MKSTIFEYHYNIPMGNGIFREKKMQWTSNSYEKFYFEVGNRENKLQARIFMTKARKNVKRGIERAANRTNYQELFKKVVEMQDSKKPLHKN